MDMNSGWRLFPFAEHALKGLLKCLCSACGRIELNCGSSTGSQPAGGFGYSSCCECEEAPTGKVVLVLLSGLNKGAEINAFRNPNAENIYTFLRESGLLANSAFSDTRTNTKRCQTKVVFYFRKFPSLGFTVHKHVSNWDIILIVYLAIQKRP